MKRIVLLTISTIAIATVSQAQITKGTVLLGGSVGAFTSKSGSVPAESKSSGFQISPTLGFTIKDNNVLGLHLSYGYNKTNSQQPTAEGNSYGAGVFFRRYLTLGKGFYLFGQATTGYNYSKTENPGNSGFKNTTEQQRVYASIYPGIAYTVSKRFHLEVGINSLVDLVYNSTKTELAFSGGHSESKSSGFGFYTNANPQSDLMVGFRIALGK